jgi:hypothetical protein
MVNFVWDGPTHVTSSGYGQAIGYYVDCDSAVCVRCIPADWSSGEYEGWKGFESWESPLAIFPDDESDSITHCSKCSAVILHDLTYEGIEKVATCLMEMIKDGNHTPDVMAQWYDAYEYEIREEWGREIIETALAEEWGHEIIETALAKAGLPVFDPKGGRVDE